MECEDGRVRSRERIGEQHGWRDKGAVRRGLRGTRFFVARVTTRWGYFIRLASIRYFRNASSLAQLWLMRAELNAAVGAVVVGAAAVGAALMSN